MPQTHTLRTTFQDLALLHGWIAQAGAVRSLRSAEFARTDTNTPIGGFL